SLRHAALVQHPAVAAVAVAHADLAAVDRRLAAQVAVELDAAAGEVFRMDQVQEALDRLLAGTFTAQAELRLELLRREDRAGLEVPVPHAVAGAVDRQDPSLVGLPQRALGGAPVGDV